MGLRNHTEMEVTELVKEGGAERPPLHRRNKTPIGLEIPNTPRPHPINELKRRNILCRRSISGQIDSASPGNGLIAPLQSLPLELMHHIIKRIDERRGSGTVGELAAADGSGGAADDRAGNHLAGMTRERRGLAKNGMADNRGEGR